MKEYLTFDDVLIVPKFSTVKSRQDVHTSVDMGRGFSFNIPIIASNMDTICGGRMAIEMARLGGLGILHRFMPVEKNIEELVKVKQVYESVGVSIGIRPGEEIRAKNLYDMGADIFCVDAAHGHSEAAGYMVKRMKNFFGGHILLIAGNVCTTDGAQYLVECGADIVKVGVGAGCFKEGSPVYTKTGIKFIEDIVNGDDVWTHQSRWRRVTKTFIHTNKKKFVKINGISATPDHEFYVVHKRHKNIITDSNLDRLAEWVSAKNLTKDYLLLQSK